MRKFLSLIFAVFMTVMAFGQSYGILVNGTTYFAGTPKGINFEGYDEFLAPVQLKAGDYCQLYDADNEAAWAVDLNPYSVEGFTRNGDHYEVAVTGCYDFYIQLKYGADRLYIGNGSDCGEGVTIGGGEGGEEAFVGFDASTAPLGEQIAAGLAKNLVNVEFKETSEGKCSVNLVKGGVEGSFSFGGVVFAYTNSADGATAWKTYGTYIQPNGKDREVRIPLKAGEKANVILVEACTGVLVNGESVDFEAGDNILTASAAGLVLKSASTKPKIQAILPVEGGDDPIVDAKYYMKNNWDAGSDWFWKEMSKDGEVYKLENVVFGGTGVNFNTAESDEGATWKALEEISGDAIEAKDTVTFVLNPAAGEVSATLVGKYQEGGDEPIVDTKYFMKNNWDAGSDWFWKEMSKDGDVYKLANVVFGGTGVNFNTAESDEGATWKALEEISGDAIEAKDTVTFVLNPAAGEVSATLVGKYQEGGDPVVDDPTVTVIGDMTEWAAEIPFTLSEDKKSATLFNDNIKPGKYEFKLKVNGEWRSNGYEYHRDFTGAAGISGNSDANMTVIIDVEGAYTFTWTFENDSLGIIFPEKTDPVVADGFYLVGTFNEWKPSAEYAFAPNPELAPGEEYMLTVDLQAGDELKGLVVLMGEWYYYPDGDNIVVTEEYAGNCTIYFRPLGNPEWPMKYIYIQRNHGQGIEETLSEGKAVKVLREGQLFIMKGSHSYTPMGQIVK